MFFSRNTIVQFSLKVLLTDTCRYYTRERKIKHIILYADILCQQVLD
jgi:hypothetical protein